MSIESQILQIYNQCKKAGWDGCDAQDIKKETIAYAFLFLKSLPVDIKSPDPTPEPDGAISFEWYTNPERLISVSVCPNGKIYYAALLGREKLNGTSEICDIAPGIPLFTFIRKAVDK